MAGVYGGYWVSESHFNPPSWAYEYNSFPPDSFDHHSTSDELCQAIGAISSNWGSVDSGLDGIAYALLGAYDLERPNSKAIVDAILAAHRSFEGKATLIENLCAVVLLRQEPLRDILFAWIRKAKCIAKHRNAIIHGSIVNISYVADDGSNRTGKFVNSFRNPNSHKAFPKKRGQDMDFQKSKSPKYDKTALWGINQAIQQVGGSLKFYSSEPYMAEIAIGTIAPSQPGNLIDSSPKPHQPAD